MMNFVFEVQVCERAVQASFLVMQYPLYVPRTRIDDNTPPEQVLWHRGHTIRLHASHVSIWCAR
jgi:hypothetical protein